MKGRKWQPEHLADAGRIWSELAHAICRVTGEDIGVRTRAVRVSWPRFIAFRELLLCGYTCTVVAEVTGYNRATVIHGAREVDYVLLHPDIWNNQVEIYKRIKKEYDEIHR